MSYLRPLAAAIALLAGPAWADDVEDSLTAALEAYRAGDYVTAKDEAEFAVTLLGQMKAQDLGGFLPAPPEGWTREEDGDQATASQMFGGGLVSAATYTDGTDDVTVTFAADSPMVTAMSAMFGNAAAMGAMGKVMRVGKHRAIVTPDGEIQSLIDRRILVSISGSAPAETKQVFFEAIDLDALAEF
ncbi:hypothetical protein P2H44_15780 [Albimonas sp. CAU 1670]|uniref:hypothetical protein n=1 Tax=Albimonas sp. CAU 1670 TaxID=3032599 RepID=UPI0023DC63C2|nr:hypothetical protein [Albimonas sp. CAU 1670]MDF2234020.1 hypothetical protein [Albimonas sp. CAU 1670]